MPGPIRLLSESWKFYRTHLITLLKLIIAPLLLTLILVGIAAVIVFATGGRQLSFLIPALIAAAVFAVIISLLGRTSLIQFIVHPESYPGLFSLYKSIWPILGKFLLTQALAGLFILLGLVLLIIPGLILAVRYLFVPFVVLAEGKSGKAALTQSSQYVKGKFWGIVGRSLFIGLLSIIISVLSTQINNTLLSSLLQLIMALVVAPLTTIYFYHLYQASKLGANDFSARRSSSAPIA